MIRPKIRERYTNVQVPDDVKAVLGRWFTDAELQMAEEAFQARGAALGLKEPEPVAKCQILYLKPRAR